MSDIAITFYQRANLTQSQIFESMSLGSNQLLQDLQSLGLHSLDDGSGGYEGNARGWLRSSVLGIDWVMGSGAPQGRIIEVFGEESVGKTAVAVLYAVACQRRNGVAVLIDTEQAASPERFRNLGLNTRTLMYKQSKPDKILTVEAIYRLMEDLMKMIYEKYPGVPIVIIWDTIAATTTEKELEGETGDAIMAEHARLHSQGLRKINQFISGTNTTVFLINQTRDKISMGGPGGGGKTTFGGRAIKFYASIRLKIAKIYNATYENAMGQPIGGGITVEAVKNKVAPPFRKVAVDLWWDERGFDNISCTLCLLKETGIFSQAGAYTQCILPSGKKISFQSKDWPEIYSENLEDIEKLLLKI